VFAFTLKSRLVWMINIMMQCLKAEGGEPVEEA